MTSHYFDADPDTDERRREIEVELRGAPVRVSTAASVFSGDRLDKATNILLHEVPNPPLQGNALDLGCGWGPIALSLALASPELEVWALDVNARALELTAENAARHNLERVRAVTADEIPDRVMFDVIWSNPPIRIGKQALDELMLTWNRRLSPGGVGWYVVGKNLGADSLQRRLVDALGDEFSVTRASTSGGFRVLRVERLG